MSTDPRERPPIHRFYAAVAAARFFTMSVLLHLVIVIVGGGAVLCKVYREAPDFLAPDGGILAGSESALPPPPQTVVTPLAQPSAPAAPGTALNAIVSTGSSQFIMASTTALPQGAALDGLKEKIAGAGKGPGAAGSRIGGTAMRLFGVQMQASSVVFCVDVSGSMISGEKNVKTYEVLEREVGKVIKGLNDQARFGLVVFSKDAKTYRRVLIRATNEEKERGLNWLRKLGPGQGRDPKAAQEDRDFHHGTRADRGLAAAFEMQPDAIFFISDGEPTGSKPPEILEQVQAAQKNLPKPAIVNTFAYLADGGQKFMAELAKQNLGTFREINPRDVK